MFNYTGKWALITGASSGIGKSFADLLAQKGCHLILVARRKDRLTAHAQILREKFKIQVHVMPFDLSKATNPHALFEEVKNQNISLDILINNAGIGLYGLLDTTDIDKHQELIFLNVFALSILSRLFLPDLLQNKGILINVASTAAFQPLPYMAVYGASKAYVLSLTEALWAEYHHQGLKVLALCPGPVETEFFGAIKQNGMPPLSKRDTAENVVMTALSAVDKDKMYVIPGPTRNYFLSLASRFAPRKLAALITEKMLRPRPTT